MAKLLKKKHIINSKGQEELLDIYTTKVEATSSDMPCKSLELEVDGRMQTCYIGLTLDLDTPKISSKAVEIDGKEYRERKYMGDTNFKNYMRNTYPDTYTTMTEIPDDLPDTSDAINTEGFFSGMTNLVTPKKIDMRNVINMQDMYNGCENLEGVIEINNSEKPIRSINALKNCKKIIDVVFTKPFKTELCNNMFAGCESLTHQIKVDTSQSKDLSYLYYGNLNIDGDIEIDGSSATNYYYSFYNCKKVKNIIINNPNNNITNVGSMLRECHNLESISELNTSNCTNFSYMYNGCSKLLNYQNLDTSKGTNFEGMYGKSNVERMPNIDTSSGFNLGGIFSNTANLLSTEYLNTKLNRTFHNMFNNDTKLSVVNNLDCSSVFDVQSFKNMLYNCNSLKSIILDNVSPYITIEKFKEVSSCPQTCNVSLNYRTIRNNIQPIKTIKAKNMKLVDIDNTGKFHIIRKGNKPLDEYIVESGDWGTIYNDRESFACFVTKDNIIYCGESYTNETRDPDFQPEIPSGITVPRSFICINIDSGLKTYSYLYEELTNMHYLLLPSFHEGEWNSYKKYEHIALNRSIIKSCCGSSLFGNFIISNSNTVYNLNIQNYNITNDRLYIAGAIYTDKTTFKSFNMYDSNLFMEELEEQLSKLKYGTTAHRILRTTTVNGKQRLVDIDVNKDMPIIINGVTGSEYNLDDYIVHESEFGTIYSDGKVQVAKLAPNTLKEYTIALEQLQEIQSKDIQLLTDETYTTFNFESQKDHEQLINDINNANLSKINLLDRGILKEATIPTPLQFGVTIFADGTIYLGRAYQKGDVLQGRPEPPEKILVPESKFGINDEHDIDSGLSIVFKDVMWKQYKDNELFLYYNYNIPNNKENSSFYTKIGKSDINMAYSNLYQEEFKVTSNLSNLQRENTLHIACGRFSSSAHDYYFGAKEIKLWNRNLTKEELELEKETIIEMSVTRDENNPSPVLHYSEEVL